MMKSLFTANLAMRSRSIEIVGVVGDRDVFMIASAWSFLLRTFRVRRRIWIHQRMKTVLMTNHLSRSVVRSPLPRYADFCALHAMARFETCFLFCVPQPSVPGAMSIDTVCQEGTFVVENVSFYKDSKLATELTSEADWKRRGLYIGPQVCIRLLFVSRGRCV